MVPKLNPNAICSVQLTNSTFCGAFVILIPNVACIELKAALSSKSDIVRLWSYSEPSENVEYLQIFLETKYIDLKIQKVEILE